VQLALDPAAVGIRGANKPFARSSEFLDLQPQPVK